MNIYKAPNVIISPKRKVYRRGVGGGGRGHSTMNPSKNTHTYTYTLSLPPSPFLSLSPPLHTYIYHSVRKRRLLGREKLRL